MDVRVDVDGDRAAERRLTRFGRRVMDMTDPMDVLGERMLDDVEQAFLTRGGGRWKPLTNSYQRWKRKRWGARPPMVLTGSLKEYMTSRRALRVTPRSVSYSLLPRGRGLAKLEDRPIVPRVGRDEVQLVFRNWLRDISRPGR
jgi:hypothetical protein